MVEQQYYYGEIGNLSQQVLIKEYVHLINRFRFNWHPQIELMVVINGSLEACVDGEVYHLEEDDVLLINSNQGHATLLKEPDTYAMVLHLDPVFFDEIREEGKSLRFTCMSEASNRYNDTFSLIRKLSSQLMEALMNDTPQNHFFVKGYTYLLIGTLINTFPPEQIPNQDLQKSRKQDRILKQILKYSERNYSQKITMKELSELTGYNQTYLSTLFKKKIGIGYYEYLTRIRLRHGIHEMNKTSKSILDIALDTGFSDVKSFSAAFKKYFLQTPKQYRKEIEGETSPVIDELVRQYISAPNAVVADKLDFYIKGQEKQSYIYSETEFTLQKHWETTFLSVEAQLDEFYKLMKKTLKR